MTMDIIQTPYGPKTPELLCKAMDALVIQPDIIEALTGLLANAPAPKNSKRDFSYILYRETASKILKRIEG